MSKHKKKRADVLLVEQGLAESRAKAQALILAGQVFRDTHRIEKAGTPIRSDVVLRVKERARFVSRGGEKMMSALAAFAEHSLEIEAQVCLDVGASTGGFSDCLLQHGAAKIYAVDVGYGQLHTRVAKDARIVVRDRTNARYLTKADFDEPIDLVVVDASFISLEKLLPAIAASCRLGGQLVALIKPQFEVGQKMASKTRGVISDPVVRQGAIDGVLDAVAAAGFSVIADAPCGLPGPKGNREHFVYARLATEPDSTTGPGARPKIEEG